MVGLIGKRSKLKKTFLHTKLHVGYEIFKEQQNIVQREIIQKKANYVKKPLQKNTNSPKELWKPLKNLGVSCKVSVSQRFVLEKITCYSSM